MESVSGSVAFDPDLAARLAGLATVADITRARLEAVAETVGGGLEVVLESPDIR